MSGPLWGIRPVPRAGLSRIVHHFMKLKAGFERVAL
jgi:hypothetical protein